MVSCCSSRKAHASLLFYRIQKMLRLCINMLPDSQVLVLRKQETSFVVFHWFESEAYVLDPDYPERGPRWCEVRSESSRDRCGLEMHP